MSSAAPPPSSPPGPQPRPPSDPAAPRPGAGPAPRSLCVREPRLSAERLVAQLVPPPRFTAARFSSYLPAPDQPSQAQAVHTLSDFAARVGGGATTVRGWSRWLPRRRSPTPDGPRGVYLDGGYGVGKTHLLAALWHAAPVAPEHKLFTTFVELTHLVGALGFPQAVRTLRAHRLLCVDEFELDDPGDTVLVSTLLGKLVDAGVMLAATSNTLPDRLGEGRFAAADFLREIQGLASHFQALRIDGEDYRHRGLPPAPTAWTAEEVTRTAHRTEGATLDTFPALLQRLATVHPSRYGALCADVTAVCLTEVQPVPDQTTALRLVVLADRLYDREVPVLSAGLPLDQLFSAEMLRGGYRKKYFRAVSRLTALAWEAAQLTDGRAASRPDGAGAAAAPLPAS